MAFDGDPSPPRRRALAATERAWRRLEGEFGLLGADEVASVLARSEPDVSVKQVAERRRNGQLLATERTGHVRYPGFQFDADGRVRWLTGLLHAIALVDGRSADGLILWMCTPCGRLSGRRPVDCMDRPDMVVRAAYESFSASW